MNTFGNLFRLTTFGESHGPAVGGVIDGMPSNVRVDMELLNDMLSRRRPVKDEGFTTSRFEEDEPEFLSGILNGVTLGTPIGFIIRNKSVNSKDYNEIAEINRPSHADYTYRIKYGIHDYRGGGRASARETVCRVVGGAFAMMVLQEKGIDINAVIQRVGHVCDDIDKMRDEASRYKAAGDSIGGIIKCSISGLPAGLGEPVYGKFSSSLASAMLSIPAVKGFDYGLGFDGVETPGSVYNDTFINDGKNENIPASNNSGGILGGITNGKDVVFRVVLKPAASIAIPQNTCDINGNPVQLKIKGRHDSCVVFRAVPVVEAMAAMVTLDQLMADAARLI